VLLGLGLLGPCFCRDSIITIFRRSVDTSIIQSSSFATATCYPVLPRDARELLHPSSSTNTQQINSRINTTSMGLWDTLTGGPQKASSTSSSSYPSSSTQQTQSYQPAPFDPTTAQDVTSFLNPQMSFDPSALHPLAGLDQDALDYLTLEDNILDTSAGSGALPSKGWSDDLCYGTGTTYLAALTLGGVWGLAEGLNRTPASAPPKLRLNACLNAITRRGPFLGNSAAVIAMVYNGFNSTIGYYRGKHDAGNSIAAGALSGMLFKSTKGIRPMAISGAMVASAAGAWAVSTSQADQSTRTNISNSSHAKLYFEDGENSHLYCNLHEDILLQHSQGDGVQDGWDSVAWKLVHEAIVL